MFMDIPSRSQWVKSKIFPLSHCENQMGWVNGFHENFLYIKLIIYWVKCKFSFFPVVLSLSYWQLPSTLSTNSSWPKLSNVCCNFERILWNDEKYYNRSRSQTACAHRLNPCLWSFLHSLAFNSTGVSFCLTEDNSILPETQCMSFSLRISMFCLLWRSANKNLA